MHSLISGCWRRSPCSHSLQLPQSQRPAGHVLYIPKWKRGSWRGHAHDCPWGCTLQTMVTNDCNADALSPLVTCRGGKFPPWTEQKANSVMFISRRSKHYRSWAYSYVLYTALQSTVSTYVCVRGPLELSLSIATASLLCIGTKSPDNVLLMCALPWGGDTWFLLLFAWLF